MDPQSCLKLIVVLPVEHHRLEPMAPEDLTRQVGGPGLEVHARRLNAALHNNCDLKLLLGQLGRGQIEEGRILVDDVDDLQGPDEEDAGLARAVGVHLQRLHLFVQLALLGDAPAHKLCRDLRPQDEIVVAQIADAKDETEPPVAQRHHSVLAEDDRLGAAAGPGQLREDQAHHEGLNKAAQDGLD